MAKKGLSFEEKQQALFQALLKKNQFFNLKEIEKIGCDANIVLQAVKQVLQSLVDDNLVKCDKIGKQNLYWVLASDTVIECRRKTEALARQKKVLEDRYAQLKSTLDFQSSKEYGDVTERNRVIAEIQALKQEAQKIEADILFQEKHGVEYTRLLKQLHSEYSDGAIRWGDNIYVLKSWLKQRCPQIGDAEINEHFEIPPDLL